MTDKPSMADIRAARARIAPHIRHTPLLRAERLDEALGCQVYLKPEMFQLTGSFKARGAFNKVLLLSPEEREKGLIASSSGNHAQALAYVGSLLGVKTVAVMPHAAPPSKVGRARALGAEVILFEGTQAERWAFVDRQVEEKGYTMVHASDDPATMAGQGTMALEILEDLPDVDTLVVPVGGGGLISGVATAVREGGAKVRVAGVEPAAAPKFHVSRKNGVPTAVPAGETMADGIREEIPGKNAYPVIARYVDELALAEEACIAEALRLLAREAHLFAEGAAAAGMGAVLSGTIRVAVPEKVCFILSGGNWDLDKFITSCNYKILLKNHKEARRENIAAAQGRRGRAGDHERRHRRRGRRVQGL